METHYVVTVDVKRVSRPASTITSPKPERDIRDLLHVTRSTDELPVAVDYAVHALTELPPASPGTLPNEITQTDIDRLRAIVTNPTTGDTNMDVVADIVEHFTGFRPAFEGGRLVP